MAYITLLSISLTPAQISYELTRQLQTNLMQKQPGRQPLHSCSPEATAAAAPQLARQPGSLEVGAMARQGPASLEAAPAIARRLARRQPGHAGTAGRRQRLV